MQKAIHAHSCESQCVKALFLRGVLAGDDKPLLQAEAQRPDEVVAHLFAHSAEFTGAYKAVLFNYLTLTLNRRPVSKPVINLVLRELLSRAPPETSDKALQLCYACCRYCRLSAADYVSICQQLVVDLPQASLVEETLVELLSRPHRSPQQSMVLEFLLGPLYGGARLCRNHRLVNAVVQCRLFQNNPSLSIPGLYACFVVGELHESWFQMWCEWLLNFGQTSLFAVHDKIGFDPHRFADDLAAAAAHPERVCVLWSCWLIGQRDLPPVEQWVELSRRCLRYLEQFGCEQPPPCIEDYLIGHEQLCVKADAEEPCETLVMLSTLRRHCRPFSGK